MGFMWKWDNIFLYNFTEIFIFCTEFDSLKLKKIKIMTLKLLTSIEFLNSNYLKSYKKIKIDISNYLYDPMLIPKVSKQRIKSLKIKWIIIDKIIIIELKQKYKNSVCTHRSITMLHPHTNLLPSLNPSTTKYPT